MSRERHSLPMLTFRLIPNPPPPPPWRHPPQGLDKLRKSTVFFQGRNSNNWLFFAHASDVWRHSHPLVTITIWDFYFDICEWHILPACTWTPALMLHLTNPCAKQKVLSLTKPKGKIYKMKSLSHYITADRAKNFWNYLSCTLWLVSSSHSKKGLVPVFTLVVW